MRREFKKKRKKKFSPFMICKADTRVYCCILFAFASCM